MAVHVEEARAHSFFVHFMLFPEDIDEEDVTVEIGRMMRHQKGGWAIVVFAMIGAYFEEFHGIEQLVNTAVRENEEIPVLLFQWDIWSGPLWMHLRRGENVL